MQGQSAFVPHHDLYYSLHRPLLLPLPTPAPALPFLTLRARLPPALAAARAAGLGCMLLAH